MSATQLPVLVLLAAVFSSVVVLADASAKPRELYDYQFQVGDDLALDLSNFVPANALNVSDLKSLAHSATSYDDFLVALAARAPHLFENYVLLHASGSIQPASLTKPRVILFGDGLMLAFAELGETHQLVEVIAFAPKTATFSFLELRFGPAGVESEDDPASCAACHGSPGRPIWDPYDFWPNAYGAAIGRFHSKQEAAAYAGVMQNPARAGIYAHLADHSQQSEGVGSLTSIETFTQYVESLAFLALATDLHRAVAVEPAFKPALFAAIQRCPGQDIEFSQFFPAATWASASTTYEDLLSDTSKERQSFKRYLRAIYLRRFPSPTISFQINHERLAGEGQVIAQMRFVMENLGVKLDNMALSSGMNRYFMSTPSNFGLDLMTAFAAIDRETMLELGYEKFSSWAKVDCDSLRTESLARLANKTFPSAPTPRQLRSAAVVTRCIRCHAQPIEGVPAIPFDDTARLVALFEQRPTLRAAVKQRVSASDATRMPPGAPLTPDEIMSFNDFLDALSH